MIQVTIFCDRANAGRMRGFDVCGHAGSGEYGHDIVCAAVSVLSQNTANSIEEFTQDDFDTELDEKKGRLKVMLKGKVSSSSDLLLKSFELGINSLIQDGNGNYIQMIYKEV